MYSTGPQARAVTRRISTGWTLHIGPVPGILPHKHVYTVVRVHIGDPQAAGRYAARRRFLLLFFRLRFSSNSSIARVHTALINQYVTVSGLPRSDQG